MNQNNLGRRKFIASLGVTAGSGLIASSFIKPDNTATAEKDCTATPIVELGPYAVMKYRKQADHDIDLTTINGHTQTAFGEIIIVLGKVTNKKCEPIQGAIVEIWSANHYGKYHHEYDKSEHRDDPNFQGWGQAITNELGEYKFKTIYPGLYGNRARHIHFKISIRDYHELTTQLFFVGEERNNKDSILNALTHEEQQQITRPVTNNGSLKEVVFNIVLNEVIKGSLPEKVLTEYIGRYTLRNTPFNMQAYLDKTMGIAMNDFDLTITHQKHKLLMTLSFYPTIELGWAAKDEFQSWSFSNTFIRFIRNEKGKVVGLRLHFYEDQYVDAAKKSNEK